MPSGHRISVKDGGDEPNVGPILPCRQRRCRDGNDDYMQPGNLFRVMPRDAQQRLIQNIVKAMSTVDRYIQQPMVQHFYKADPAYGGGIAVGLGIDLQKLAA